jgi:hypothetical protein
MPLSIAETPVGQQRVELVERNGVGGYCSALPCIGEQHIDIAPSTFMHAMLAVRNFMEDKANSRKAKPGKHRYVFVTEKSL